MSECLHTMVKTKHDVNGRKYALFQRELAQINLVLRSSDQIDELPHLRLERRLQEELQNINIVALPAEMLLEKVIDRSLEHERVVYGDLADFGDAVPAGLASARDGRVHHVVRDEEEGLELRVEE